MSRSNRLTATFALLLLTAFSVMGQAGGGGTTERVSVSSSGEQGNGSSGPFAEPCISPDGRFVAFTSFASNLVPEDTNGTQDIFVFDRQTRTIERVSVSSSGEQGYSESTGSASISADGRFVAFDSTASNLVPGDNNGTTDVFVRDRQNGTTERVSISSSGKKGNSYSVSPSIRADGRLVAFGSNSSNLVTGDTNGTQDIFVRDRQAGITERVSISSSGEQANDWSYAASISADGRYVAFTSYASNLVSGDSNGTRDVFVRDLQAGTTECVSVSSAGKQGNRYSESPSISADGRFVAFTSDASNLASDDSNGTQDVFVHDRQTGTTERVSVSSSSEQGNDGSFSPSISWDGRFVGFSSDATNFVPGGIAEDVFVHDRQTGSTERESVSSSGQSGNYFSFDPSISADGRYVAFGSDATNLVPDDTNGTFDVFVRDRGAGSGGSLTLTLSPNPTPGNAFAVGTVRIPSTSQSDTAVALTAGSPSIAPLVNSQGNEKSSITVTIPAGQTETTFLVHTKTVPTRQTAHFTATAGGQSGGANLTVLTQTAATGVITLRRPGDATGGVKGIVCDNSTATVDDANLVDQILLETGANVQDAAGYVASTAGGLTGDGSVALASGKAMFRPPLEFGPSTASTRTVKLNLLYKSGGQWYQVSGADIVLARPVTMLVHGINTGPDGWKPFVKDLNVRPLDAIDYSDLQNGNAPVEQAASRLQGEIGSALDRLHKGTFTLDRTFSTGSKDKNPYHYTFAYTMPLCAKRVDIVCWSYGGMVTRWYLASTGATPSGASSDSLNWYQRDPGDWWNLQWDGKTVNWYQYKAIAEHELKKSPVAYEDDVRKVITLGTMWRGVPLANWLNEILSVGGSQTPSLGDGRTAPPVSTIFANLRDFAFGTPVPPAAVASMEVMAIESPWLRWVIYGDGSSPAPFKPKVEYFAIAGGNNRYLWNWGDGQINGPDVYSLASAIDADQLFPWLHLEVRQLGMDDPKDLAFSDSIVPLWSQMIPGASAILDSNHSDYPSNAEILIKPLLDAAGMKSGAELNGIWQSGGYVESHPVDGHSFRWNFDPAMTAPAPQSSIYTAFRGVGRINPYYIKQKVNWSVSKGAAGVIQIHWTNMAPFTWMDILDGDTPIGATTIRNKETGTFKVSNLASGRNLNVKLRLWFTDSDRSFSIDTDSVQVKVP